MRPAFRLPLITGMLVLLVVAAIGYQRYAVDSAIQELSDQLNATTVDFACEKMPLPDALKLLLQKLAAKNPHFKDCTFQLDFEYPRPPDPLFPDRASPLVTLELKDAPGIEVIKYVTELSGVYYGFRPGMVVFGPIGVELPTSRYRTWTERVSEAASDALYQAKYAIRSKLGL